MNARADRAVSNWWSPDPMSLARMRARHILALLVGGAAAALMVIFDPLLSGFVPAGWWAAVGMKEWPLHIVPVFLVLLLAAALLIRNLPGYLTVLIATLQMNGLRAGPLDVVDLALLAGVAVLAAQLFSRPETDLRLGIPGHLALLLILFGLPHIVVQESLVRFGIGMFALLRSLLIAIVVLNLVRTEAQLRHSIHIVVTVAFLSALIGLAQFIASYFWGIHFTLIDPPDTAFKPTPIGVVMRSSGLCITAQHQSGFLAMALPFALWRASKSWRVADVAAAFVIGLGVIVTWNMGAIIITVGAMLAFALFRWPERIIHISLAVMLALTALYYLDGYSLIYDQVFNASVAKGASQRATLLSIGLDKLNRDMLVGTGPQGFATFSGNFWGRPVHNTFIQIATELGIVASLMFVAGMLIFLTAIMLTLKDARRPRMKETIACMMLTQGTLFGIMLSEPMMDHSNTWFFLAIAQAALFISRQATGEASIPPRLMGQEGRQ